MVFRTLSCRLSGDEPVKRFWPRWASAILLALVLTACGGAYAQAVKRGDEFAAAGLWDQAAAQYEQAVQLRPGDADAQIKLQQARRMQSLERVQKGQSLLARGELEGGLAAIQEAVSLDPENPDAQQALTEANAQVLDEAEKALSGPDPTRALALTTLVLKGSPNDPRAQRVDAKVRDTLAEQAYSRAQNFEQKGKKGNALVEYAAALSFREAYRDAKLRLGALKMELQQELMFYVVLESFADETPRRDVAKTLSVDLLGQSFNPKLPLQVVQDLPQGTESPRGVKLSGRFHGYSFQHDQRSESRTCDYQCGSDTKPNPQFAEAERDVASTEQNLASREEEVARREKDVMDAQKEVDRYQKYVDEEQEDVDQARANLDNCRSRYDDPEEANSRCSSEESRLRSEESALRSARDRLESPRRTLTNARDRLTSAQKSRNDARRAKDQATERMRDTPRTIEVPRYCAHNYRVAIHSVASRIAVQLTAERLEDGSKLLNGENFEYQVAKQDETFPAHPGRCQEVASGNPLVLPSEGEVKQQLVTQAIGSIRDKVMGTYDSYRQRFLADARREEAAGLEEEAVEAYVRYVLTGVDGIDAQDQKRIAEFLHRTRGFGKLDLLEKL